MEADVDDSAIVLAVIQVSHSAQMVVQCWLHAKPNNLTLHEVLALWSYNTNPHAKCLVSALASRTCAALLVIVVSIPVQRPSRRADYM